ncbi:MAG: hypothetical protein MUD08_14405 [Cytophagales bacterium]|jgi:hypothetical protein|nr:hypothetical protein [Cytophagales bacterium]
MKWTKNTARYDADKTATGRNAEEVARENMERTKEVQPTTFQAYVEKLKKERGKKD